MELRDELRRARECRERQVAQLAPLGRAQQREQALEQRGATEEGARRQVVAERAADARARLAQHAPVGHLQPYRGLEERLFVCAPQGHRTCQVHPARTGE